ncbi:MAG: glutamate ligase domain-containing protein, partial [Planctomycetota bacterium]
ALDSFDCPPIIIAGGYDKNLPFDELGAKIAQRAKAAILLGQTAPKIAEAIEDAGIEHRASSIERVDSLAQAVSFAAKIAIPGDVVLLSPACASYDMFENFQQRGREFTNLVENIGKA